MHLFQKFFLGVAVIIITATAFAETQPSNLDRDLQNPLSRLYLLPLQYNAHHNVGPFNRNQNVLNIQPVVPVVGEKWLTINRFVVPVIDQPDAVENKSTFGLGDILYQGYFSPMEGIRQDLWGLGPAFQFPSGSDEVLSSKKWSVGPTFAWVSQPGNWTLGGLFTQLWSFAGDDDRDDVNQLQIQPLIYYRMSGGTSLSFLHTINANWNESSGNQWTVPVGLSINQIVVHPYFYPYELQFGVYGNVIRPENSSDWLLKLQINFVLPR